MAVVLFYEKPGCGTNARQKRMLEKAGHIVITRNLLSEKWSAEGLREFFAGTPVASWFNPAAPRIKSGEIDPTAVGADTALALMIDDPLLIRRPLVDVQGLKCAGFDREPVLTLLDEGEDETRGPALEICLHSEDSGVCRDPDPPQKALQL